MNSNLTETARSLLALHDGTCSVLRDSPIGEAFAEMERAGEVELSISDTHGFVNVRRKLFLWESDILQSFRKNENISLGL